MQPLMDSYAHAVGSVSGKLQHAHVIPNHATPPRSHAAVGCGSRTVFTSFGLIVFGLIAMLWSFARGAVACCGDARLNRNIIGPTTRYFSLGQHRYPFFFPDLFLFFFFSPGDLYSYP